MFLQELDAPNIAAAAPAFVPEIVLFAVSQYTMSAGRHKRLEAALQAACPVPARLVRFEGETQSIPKALDALVADGYRTILLQPLGLPFSEGLRAWTPNAVSHWLAGRAEPGLDVRIGGELADLSSMVEIAVDAAMEHAATASPAVEHKPRLGKPGWETVPDFTHHLLVCTGPRCHFRDGASLAQAVKAETVRQGVNDQCLTTTTGCMYPCNKGPMVAVYPKGEWYRLETAEEVERFVAQVLVNGRTLPDLLIHRAAAAVAQPEPA